MYDFILSCSWYSFYMFHSVFLGFLLVCFWGKVKIIFLFNLCKGALLLTFCP